MSDWNAMQQYEKGSGLDWLRANYLLTLTEYEHAKERGEFIPPMNFYETDDGIDKVAFQKLLTHITGKRILEVGCGPAGCIPLWRAHVGQRILLDPLLDVYRTAVDALVHERSWFTPDMLCFAQPAETTIPALYKKVDGMILCRNCLDHCEEPYKVLDKISSYAAPGCWLLLWTDLYMPNRDAGHVNITQDREGFAEEVRLRGWQFQREFHWRPEPDIDFGTIAMMKG